MLENTTVTLPLRDFDTLREGEREYRNIARALSACFEYTCENHPEPPECKNCSTETDCPDCEHYAPDYIEKLTVDVERLIRVAKEYALYGKDIEAEIDEIPLERKPEGAGGA